MTESLTDRINTNTPGMDHLLRIYGAGGGIHVINKAIEKNIFEMFYLEKKPIPAAEFARKNRFKPEILVKLLDCLTSLKLLRKERENGIILYSNRESGDLLAKSNPNAAVAMQSWMQCLTKGFLDTLNKMELSEGEDSETKGKEMSYDYDDWSYESYKGQHNFLAPQAKQLVTHHNFQGYKTCFDLGGGTGVLAFELRRQYPDMDVTVVERENVVQIAEEKFVPGNEHMGVKFIKGDFFKIPFPDLDLFVLANVIRSLNDKQKDDLISKCFKALNPGGGILVLDHMLNEHKGESMWDALWDLSFTSWNTKFLTPSEFKTLFTEHGFSEVTCTFTQEWNECDLIFARKCSP